MTFNTRFNFEDHVRNSIAKAKRTIAWVTRSIILRLPSVTPGLYKSNITINCLNHQLLHFKSLKQPKTSKMDIDPSKLLLLSFIFRQSSILFFINMTICITVNGDTVVHIIILQYQ